MHCCLSKCSRVRLLINGFKNNDCVCGCSFCMHLCRCIHICTLIHWHFHRIIIFLCTQTHTRITGILVTFINLFKINVFLSKNEVWGGLYLHKRYLPMCLQGTNSSDLFLKLLLLWFKNLKFLLRAHPASLIWRSHFCRATQYLQQTRLFWNWEDLSYTRTI